MGINLGSGAISKLYLGATEIQKAYLGGNLVYDAGGAAWTPANLANLAAWYDASDLSTITESGGAVSQWDDKSGNTNHLVQATGAKQPRTGVLTQNSLNLIDFAGGDLMQVTLAATQSSASIIAVGRLNQANYAMYNISVGDSISFRIAQLTSGTGPVWRMVYDDDVAVQFILTLVDPSTIGLTTAISDDPNDTIYLGANGQLILGSQAVGTVTINADTLTVGALESNGLLSMVGEIAEIIITSDALTSTDYQKAEGYLGHKWGLTANLPAGHPYKTVAP